MSDRTQRPTMADVGAAAGVSDRTVSNVLSGKIPVRPETREAVLRAVADLGYRMNATARGLRTGRTGTITLALPDLGYDFFSQLAHAVMLEADRVGWAVTVQQTGSQRDRELAILSGSDTQPSDGLIFQAHALGPEEGREALALHARSAHQLPIVLMGDRIVDEPVDHVMVDNLPAAQAATSLLISSGRRMVAAIGPDPASAAPDSGSARLHGYRQALEQAGLPWRPDLVWAAPAWRRAEGANVITALLEAHPEVDGVFCTNDDLALGVLHALSRRGVRVPDDIAVVGFDDVTAAAYSHPPLTTINSGGRDLAKAAVSLLADRAAGYEGPARKIVADFKVVRRHSA